MDAQLVHAPRVGFELQQGGRGIVHHCAIRRLGRFGVRVIGRAGPHIGLAAPLLASQRRLDHARQRFGRPRGHDRPVGLLHPARHDRLAEEAGGRLGLGGHDHAGGVAVEPMHQLGPLAVGPGEGPQQVIKCVELAAPTLARQAGRLGQGQDVGVLEDHHGAHGGDLVRRQLDRLAAHLPFLALISAQRSSRSFTRASEPSPLGR